MFDTANDITVEPGVGEVLAANLRRLRVARHLSLSELARATGIGKATLSAIEGGGANPTVGTLTLLAAALRVRLAELLEEPALGEIRVVRAREQRPATAAGAFDARAIAAFAAEGMVELLELFLPPRRAQELEPRAAGVREELFVLQGTLISGPVERVSELSAGDYASFPADVPRLYEAGRHAARALLLVHA